MYTVDIVFEFYTCKYVCISSCTKSISECVNDFPQVSQVEGLKGNETFVQS